MAKHRKRRRRRSHRKSNPAHARVHHRRTHRRRRRHNPIRAKRRHHRRRNPSSPLATLGLAVLVGAGTGIIGNLAAKQVASMLPASIPAWGVDAGKIALGLGAGFMLRKHPPIAAGVAVGLAAPSVSNLIKPVLPASLQGFDAPDVYSPPALIEALASDVHRIGARVENIEAIAMEGVSYGP